MHNNFSDLEAFLVVDPAIDHTKNLCMINPFLLLDLRAKIQPNKIALAYGSTQISYLQLHLFVKKVACKLHDLGIKSDDFVLTALPPHIDFIVTLALFHEAAKTASGTLYASISELNVDWIITQKALKKNINHPHEKIIMIDDYWLGEAMVETPKRNITPYADSEKICRIIFTSGTTGTQKGIAFSIKNFNERLRNQSTYWRAPGKELQLMSLHLTGGFFSAMNKIYTGDTFYCTITPEEIIDTIQKNNIYSIIGSPFHLKFLISMLESHSIRLDCVKEIRSSGGRLSRDLIVALYKNFDAEFFNVYGSTEAGGVSLDCITKDYDMSSAGYPINGAHIQIVNEFDEILPSPEVGIVRVRNYGMVDGYYNDQQASAKNFKDGWFYPGDLGNLTREGKLILQGRKDEIINMHGVKIDPSILDDALQGHPGIKDLAFFEYNDQHGHIEVAVAIVGAEVLNVNTIAEEMLSKANYRIPSVKVFYIDEIPRNQMGKIMRSFLTQKFFNA